MITNEQVDAVAKSHQDNTDSGPSVSVVARWFRDALDICGRNGEGEAAVEIGVRRGGTSAVLCELAALDDAVDPVEVLSVDPWGGGIIWSPKPLAGMYGDTEYACTRQLLAQYPHSTILRMRSAEFIGTVLPSYRWWRGGVERPAKRRFIAFAFLDGNHEDTAVVEEAAGIAPYVCSGGIIAIDNTEHCPGAVGMLERSPRLMLRHYASWEPSKDSPGPDGLRREAFQVP